MTSPADLRRTDADQRRYYQHPTTGDALLSVTTVIEATISKPWLQVWSAKLAVQWMIGNLGLIEELGEAEFMKLAASAAARARELKADAGTYVHDVLQAIVLWQAAGNYGQPGMIPELPEHLDGTLIDGVPIDTYVMQLVAGFLNFVADHDPEFMATEMAVFNRDLGIAGTLDAICYLRKLRTIVCIDYKTGKHLDAVDEQLAAYRRMTECLLPMGDVAPMPRTQAGMVLHLRPEHPRGYKLLEVAPANDHAAWNRFRRAVRLHGERAECKGRPGRAMYPPLPDGSQPPPRLDDLDGYGRVISPLIKAGHVYVTDVAELTLDGCYAVKGIGAKTAPVVAQMLADHNLTFATTPEPQKVAA